MSATAFQRMRREALAREQAEIETEVVDTSVKDIEEAHKLALEEESAKQLENSTIAELKGLLDEKGIEYNSRTKKEDLIKLLEGAE